MPALEFQRSALHYPHMSQKIHKKTRKRASDLVFDPTLACWRVRKRVAFTTAPLGKSGRSYP